jgi:hypothetical protein
MTREDVEVVAALHSGQRRDVVAAFFGRLRGARSGTRVPVFGSTDSSSFAKAPHRWLIFFVWEPRGHQSTPPLLIRSSPNFPGPYVTVRTMSTVLTGILSTLNETAAIGVLLLFDHATGSW